MNLHQLTVLQFQKERFQVLLLFLELPELKLQVPEQLVPEFAQPELPEHLYFVVEFQQEPAELQQVPELLQEQVLPELEQELEPVLLLQLEELLQPGGCCITGSLWYARRGNMVEPELADIHKPVLEDMYNKAL